MLARRVARRLIVPAAYTVVLVLLLTGLWPHVQARLAAPAPGGAPAASRAATAGPLRAADAPRGSQVGLQAAIASVRTFTGDSSLTLDGGLQSEDTGRGVSYFYLETQSTDRGEDVFKVDARTAEVVEATFRSRLAATGVPVDLPFDAAERTAERYARERFTGFEHLTLVDRSTRPSEDIAIHSFKWSQLAPSGAELPTSVSVAVSGGGGDVIWYLAQRDSVQVSVQPTVARDRAIETARDWLGDRDGQWETSSPLAVRLQVLYDDDDRQQLVWSVAFRGRPGSDRASVRLLVDAHNGQILTPAS